MSDTKDLIEFLDEYEIVMRNGIPFSKYKLLTEIKGIVEEKNKYSLKGVCEWWIKTYPEDVFKGYEYITDIREHMIKILEKLQVAIPQCENTTPRQQPQPDELVEKMINLAESLGVRLKTSPNYPAERQAVEDKIRKLLPRPSVTRKEISEFTDGCFSYEGNIKTIDRQSVLSYFPLALGSFLKSKGIEVKGAK